MTSVGMAPAFGKIVLEGWQHYVDRNSKAPVHTALTFTVDGPDQLGDATSLHVRTEGPKDYSFLLRDPQHNWVPKSTVSGDQFGRVMTAVVNQKFDTAAEAQSGPTQPTPLVYSVGSDSKQLQPFRPKANDEAWSTDPKAGIEAALAHLRTVNQAATKTSAHREVALDPAPRILDRIG